MRNKDIIKQYVNTGRVLPEYQFSKLNSSLLKSYFRTRKKCLYDDSEVVFDVEGNAEPPGINSAPLRCYEFLKLSDDDKNFYIKRIVNCALLENEDEIDVLPREFIVLIDSTYRKIIIEYLFANNDFKKIINFFVFEYMFFVIASPLWFKNKYGLQYNDYIKRMEKSKMRILDLLCFSSNKTEIIKAFNVNLDDYCNRQDFYHMLSDSTRPDLLIDIFGQKIIDYIKSLDVDELNALETDAYHNPVLKRVITKYAQ